MRSKKAAALTVIVMVICVVAVNTVPSAGAEKAQVTVHDATAQPPAPCPELDSSAYPIISGGCLVHAKRSRMSITILSAFGQMRMGGCDVSFDLHIGPRGDVWMQGLSSKPPDAFCSDFRTCRRDLKEHLPWKGRISRAADGRYEIAFDMCLDTCVGRYEGKIIFDLVRERGDWRMRTKRSVAGTSGLQLDADWDLDALNLGPTTERYFDRAGRGAPGFDLR